MRKVTIVAISYYAPQGNQTASKDDAASKRDSTLSIARKGNAKVEREVESVNSGIASQANTPSTPIAPKKQVVSTEDLNEVFPVVNERGITIGRAARWQCHDGSKLLHPVVHLFVFNSEGELFLQKRPDWKVIQPGKWDTSVGGHIAFGEKVENALKRETLEEIGIEAFTPVFLKRYVFESAREKELVNAYKTVYDGIIAPSAELNGGKFWSSDEILENIGKKIFTPNFEKEYLMFFK